MSYQLIYHRPSEHLLTTTSAGTVARSRTIPRALEQSLIELTHSLYTGAQITPGLYYSYLKIENDSAPIHVLSSHQFDTEQGYTVHHLAMTYDEVQVLRRNASRPTPAGLILALRNIGLWCTHSATERFPYIDDEPRLTAAALPEADNQPTWEKFTGNKSNARCFFTSPYDRDCVVTVPADATPQEVLMLLHESDWLSSTRGWDKTFTTLVSSNIDKLHCNRIILHQTAPPPGSLTWLPHSQQLTINPQLVLGCAITNAQQSAQSATVLPPRKHGSRATESTATSHLPYKYTETPDVEVFKVLPPPNKWLRWACYLVGTAALWSSFSLISGLMMDEAGELTGDIITQINTEEDALLLSRLAASTYSYESTARHLDKFEARLRNLPASGQNNSRVTLLECVRLLRAAAETHSNHPDNLQKLSECAHTLKLNAGDLCRLYMHESIQSYGVHDWSAQAGNAEREAWQIFLNNHPDMAAWLLQPPFAPYLAPLNLTQPPTQEPQTNGTP